MVAVLENKRDAIVALCRQYGVVRLDVFGSALRDDFRPGESDVDLLVEFAPIRRRPISTCSTTSAPCSVSRSTW